MNGKIHRERKRGGQGKIRDGSGRERKTRTSRSPAVARMADRTAPVIGLTLTLTLTSHNVAKTGTSPQTDPL